MPIYAYRCATCGHARDVLRKMSDPALTTCPECGASTFEKQVTAAGFQLKGSGWYVTDFKGDGKKPAGAPNGDAKADGAPADSSKAEPAAAPAPASAGASKSEAAAAPSTAPAPAAPSAPASK